MTMGLVGEGQAVRVLPGGGGDPTDDGRTPPHLATALSSHALGHLGIAALVEVLAASRLLLPLLEVDSALLPAESGSAESGSAESGSAESGSAESGSAEFGSAEPGAAEPQRPTEGPACAGGQRAVAVVSTRTGAGRVALAFTSVERLHQWNQRSRPLPAAGTRAALSALDDGCAALVVDAGSSEQVAVSGSALVRMARGERWPVPWEDPLVAQAIVGELAGEMAAGLRVRLREGPEQSGRAQSLIVELAVADCGDPDLRSRIARGVAGRLAADPALRAVYDGVLAIQVS